MQSYKLLDFKETMKKQELCCHINWYYACIKNVKLENLSIILLTLILKLQKYGSCFSESRKTPGTDDSKS